VLRAVKDLDADLPSTLIDEATAAPTDKLVMVEAITSAPWVSELEDEDPIAAAKLRSFKLRQEMTQKAGGVLSSGKVAEMLGISRQAVDKRRVANQLLAVTQGRRGYSYPSFQFEDGTTLDGVEEVLSNLSAVDPWMQLNFFTTPHERLGNQTPIEALRSGRVVDVVRAASGYGEQGAM
jgi:biotin operon repressor